MSKAFLRRTFIQKGWCVVNIDYRLLSQAPMPASPTAGRP
jgi:acetyl esterase/lipase